MAIIVQESAQQFHAAQFDGTNGADFAAPLQATGLAVQDGTLSFSACTVRSGQLLCGHQFSVPTGWWIVWAAMQQPLSYVVAVLSAAAFADRYVEVCDCDAIGADVTTLQGQVATLQGQMVAGLADISTLEGQISTAQGDITALEAQTTDLFSNYVGRLAAGVASFESIPSLDSGQQSVVPSGSMVDNDFTRQAFLVSLGDTSLLADLEITAIDAVDDLTTQVTVVNNGVLASPAFQVAVLHVHN